MVHNPQIRWIFHQLDNAETFREHLCNTERNYTRFAMDLTGALPILFVWQNKPTNRNLPFVNPRTFMQLFADQVAISGQIFT